MEGYNTALIYLDVIIDIPLSRWTSLIITFLLKLHGTEEVQ